MHRALVGVIACGDDVEPAVAVHIGQVDRTARQSQQWPGAVERRLLQDKALSPVVAIQAGHAVVAGQIVLVVDIVLAAAHDDVNPSIVVIVAHAHPVAATAAVGGVVHRPDAHRATLVDILKLAIAQILI